MGHLIDNRYRILESLGAGGMAEVFLAHDEDLGRRVALKVLSPYYAGDQEFVERFRGEDRFQKAKGDKAKARVLPTGASLRGRHLYSDPLEAGGRAHRGS